MTYGSLKGGSGQPTNISATPSVAETLKSLGETLRLARGTLSQAELADRVGSTSVTVRRYERGERSPDVPFLLAVVSASGVDAGWLLTGTGQPKLKRDGAAADDLSEEDIDLLLDCYAAGEMILRDHKMHATHEEKKAATIKMFRREKAGSAPVSATKLSYGQLDSSETEA